MNALVNIDAAGLTYSNGSRHVALSEVTATLGTGEFVAIVGKSGSGKSSLLHLMTGIERPSQGRVAVDGTNLGPLSETALARWRGRTVGIVFQFFQLVPSLTAVENVALPMELARQWNGAERRRRAALLLERVGLGDRLTALPRHLSGGEQQRVALARALANDPPLIFADEPTGNLDSQNALVVTELLQGLVADGKTVVVVTHDRDLAAFSRVLTLSDGRLVNDTGVSS